MLPIRKQTTTTVLPQISAHFLIMYLVGMLSRYHLKEWGEIIKGEKSGEIYVVQKFLEVTKRKFPNLILNELQGYEFFFTSPKMETRTDKKLDEEQLGEIYEYINRRFAQEWHRI